MRDEVKAFPLREDAKASTLRQLADAIDKRAKANTLPGISCPVHIKFEGPGSSSMGAYGDNPTLLEAIKVEIRREWDRLRAQALARLDGSVETLNARCVAFMVPAPESHPEPPANSVFIADGDAGGIVRHPAPGA